MGYLFVRRFGTDFAVISTFTAGTCRNGARMPVMSGCEKRKCRRLAIKLDLFCRKVGSPAGSSYTGYTTDVSPGGLHFETSAGEFQPGDLLRLELSIPPTTGLLELGGKVTALARVLRTTNPSPSSAAAKCGVAAEFCHTPKLCT